MNTLETIIIINALTGWGVKNLEKVSSCDFSLMDSNTPQEISLEKIINNIRESQYAQKNRLINFKEYFDLKNELLECDQKGISIIPFYDKKYPESLKNIDNPPLLLYVLGNIEFDSEKSLAVVGSRKCTSKGRSFAFNISSQLASHNISIISGLAYGIDAEAHRGTISGKGKTIAVLGSGLCNIYPKNHSELSKEISINGAVISEFPLSTEPLGRNFPRRNRIISGLSKGVLIVEAALKSGSLITARYAIEQGKDVFAVPGNPYDKYSEGTNDLIRDGARITTSVEDILEEFSLFHALNSSENKNCLSFYDPNEKDDNFSSEEKEILSNISIEPQPLDSICTKCKLDFQIVSHILLTLELKKYIKVYPGNRYGLNYRRLKS
ncbi:MAG: DNA-processing protein DprA [Candidatus Aureabacteria bacterium]|nr:DNA-processing protein DprA [Candidatus Auribacterota bacterium]